MTGQEARDEMLPKTCVTDEMVSRAADGIERYDDDQPSGPFNIREDNEGKARAALEAAMPRGVAFAWEEGFRAGWQATGEGYNGEWPDEGVPWAESAGHEAMLRARVVVADLRVPIAEVEQ